MSFRNSRPTTLRPRKTHSALPAGPLTWRAASVYSSARRWASASTVWLAAGFSAGLSAGLASVPWAIAGSTANRHAAANTAAEQERRRDMGPFFLLEFRDGSVAISVL